MDGIVGYFSEASNLVAFKPDVVELAYYQLELGAHAFDSTSGYLMDMDRPPFSFDGSDVAFDTGGSLDFGPGQVFPERRAYNS